MPEYNSSPYRGSGQITREQFLFYEMRTTAKLVCEGISNEEVIDRIVSDNLFQYPTEKTVKQIAMGCLRRLEVMQDDALIHAIADQPSDISKQICLYAMMKQYRLIWDFMITVIGTKNRNLDTTYSRADLNAFFLRLQEQDDLVASWSLNTINKIKQVITRVLVENEYLDNANADHINPVLISPLLENAIREAGQEIVLPAFNCLS